MEFSEIIIVFFIALFIAGLFSYGFKRTGPWGGFWIFLLLLFLVAWAARLWVLPVGPVFWGFGWIATIFVVIIFALLVAAASGTANRPGEGMVVEKISAEGRTEETRPALGFGIFFWMLMLILVFAILMGYLD